MTEDKDRRSYTARVFNLDHATNGAARLRHECHIGHIHFKDQGVYYPCDTRLVPQAGGWEQTKASYHCQIPQYADGFFDFYDCYEGKNHSIVAVPQAAHVEGVLASTRKRVVFADAFGSGIDLEAATPNHGLRKEIVIRKKPSVLQDLHFDFELHNFDQLEIRNSQNQVWDKLTSLSFKDEMLLVGAQGQYSYFRPALVWDSVGHVAAVDIQLYRSGSKVFLRKTVSAQFLANAVYPVRTDHPTNYFAGAGDGEVYLEGYTSWDATHDAFVGDEASYTATGAYMGIRSYDATNHEIRRCFLPFNTSGIGAGQTVTAALLKVQPVDKYNTDNDGDDWINVVQTTQASTSSLVVGDYDQCGAIDNPTEGATRIDLGSITLDVYNTWTLNATGRGWVNVTGWTKLGMREGHDCIDSMLANGKRNSIAITTSEEVGTDNDPYLDITSEAAGGVTSAQVIIVQ